MKLNLEKIKHNPIILINLSFAVVPTLILFYQCSVNLHNMLIKMLGELGNFKFMICSVGIQCHKNAKEFIIINNCQLLFLFRNVSVKLQFQMQGNILSDKSHINCTDYLKKKCGTRY